LYKVCEWMGVKTYIIDNSKKICELFEDWDMYLTIYKEKSSLILSKNMACDMCSGNEYSMWA
jgi:hypothetical protein